MPHRIHMEIVRRCNELLFVCMHARGCKSKWIYAYGKLVEKWVETGKVYTPTPKEKQLYKIPLASLQWN